MRRAFEPWKSDHNTPKTAFNTLGVFLLKGRPLLRPRLVLPLHAWPRRLSERQLAIAFGKTKD